MLMNRVLLLGLLFVGSTGLSNAAPLDSPGIVYIDGAPCNSACQSYMAWSRQTLSGRPVQGTPKAAEHHAAEPNPAPSKPAVRGRVARQVAATRQARRGKIGELRETVGNAIPTHMNKPAEAAVPAAPISPGKPAADVAEEQQPSNSPAPSSAGKPVEDIAALQQPADPSSSNPVSKANPSEVLAKPSSDAGSKTIRDQVMAATAMAEQLSSTAAARPELRAMSSEPRDDATAAIPAERNVAASPNETDALVALVMSLPEIKSVTDLAGKTVAIDSGRSKSSTDVRTALVAAGAGEVQLSTGEPRAIERLVNGEVPAAVVTLVSPDAAEAFPEIAGFRVFRIPLSPRSLKAQRQDAP
ncbi:MAG TPA: hypothetical protein VNS33_01810 [Bradyrhizobium sp.]|nr:hypothetical protein [Bradyrhizobium sp.]